ncbi:LmbE-like protein [Exidia glandulosa HHB12029]|uniref:N-acetylglucosaminylphosphatidylinositol deacetylase n=1 Tax=Exidia glandulosa HHB12029 TaxID=1314781 RepID=A0A165KU43_EXIGL|nr:LmbE-like protein [Exidia glandulosa HHB12029]
MPNAASIWIALLAILVSSWLLPATYNEPLKCLGSRVLLLTAHPDDECMFFAPTVLALTSSSDVELHSLCLSTGDADGLGKERVQELAASLDILGIPANRSRVLDLLDLRDDITKPWNHHVIAAVVQHYVHEHRIDTILPFDAQGVSSHPNHASLSHGARLVQGVRVATLHTVPLWVKYHASLPALLHKSGISRFLPSSSASHGTYSATAGQYLRAVQAMQAHRTQMVWFRWLYITFSRYMWTNDWICVR